MNHLSHVLEKKMECGLILEVAQYLFSALMVKKFFAMNVKKDIGLILLLEFKYVFQEYVQLHLLMKCLKFQPK